MEINPELIYSVRLSLSLILFYSILFNSILFILLLSDNNILSVFLLKCQLKAFVDNTRERERDRGKAQLRLAFIRNVEFISGPVSPPPPPIAPHCPPRVLNQLRDQSRSRGIHARDFLQA